jgi:hypothetical protein
MPSFLPLLEAERKQELLVHAERQLQWSEDRLKKEGYMVDRLGATNHPTRSKLDLHRHIYSFARTGKEAAGKAAELAHHKFT